MMRRILYLLVVLPVLWLAYRPAIETEAPVVAAAQIDVREGQFAEYIAALSEPEGSFDTDNFISNETSYLHVIEELQSRFPPGTVYLGVGPDQNFSYIVHAQPALAIIVDIRRQNMLQHLLYKAIFDLSGSRSEFLARLFCREDPKTDVAVSLPALLRAIRQAPACTTGFRQSLSAIRDRVTTRFGLDLSAEDHLKIEYVYRTMSEEGLDLRFSSIGRNNAASYPTFESLLLQTDRSGRQQGYLATEELFLRLKKYQAGNRVIPVVGDFAGRRAMKSIGDFLRRNQLQVGAFYTSNVEFYLFGGDQWDRYIGNLRALPVAPNAIFIRSYFGNSGSHPGTMPGHRSTTLIQPIDNLLEDDAAGRLQSYSDVIFP